MSGPEPDCKYAVVCAQNQQPRRRWFGKAAVALLTALAALFMFYVALTYYDRYASGTPVTATVTDCARDRKVDCQAHWTIGGVDRAGPIAASGFDETVRKGATVNVHVAPDGSKAYSSTTWLAALGIGIVLLGVSTACLVATVRQSRS